MVVTPGRRLAQSSWRRGPFPVAIPPTGGPVQAAIHIAGRAFTTRVRTRWYRVRIALYQLPNLPGPGSVNQSGNSSGFGGIGSARRGKPRTSLSFTVFVGPGGAAKQ